MDTFTSSTTVSPVSAFATVGLVVGDEPLNRWPDCVDGGPVRRRSICCCSRDFATGHPRVSYSTRTLRLRLPSHYRFSFAPVFSLGARASPDSRSCAVPTMHVHSRRCAPCFGPVVTVPTATQFRPAMFMPNLVPPITTAAGGGPPLPARRILRRLRLRPSLAHGRFTPLDAPIHRQIDPAEWSGLCRTACFSAHSSYPAMPHQFSRWE